ncbi:MAG: sulfotransferase [Pseudomonadota bacterium]
MVKSEIQPSIDELLDDLGVPVQPPRGASVSKKPGLNAADKEILSDIFDMLKSACASKARPLPMIHHFACTGGTILSRCLGAQPNVALLSEIDPLSPSPLGKPGFAPYDLIRQLQTGPRIVSVDTVSDIFIDYLSSLYDNVTALGYHLVIRDHTHSHFCVRSSPDSRKSIAEILGKQFEIRSVLTVRHPLDSFLSLRRKGWVMFAPDTMEEYAKRYTEFLDRYPNAPIVKYEDFVEDPASTARLMTSKLGLSYFENWEKVVPLVRYSGDSGRSGDKVSIRERRPVSGELMKELDSSAAYRALCSRLRYE